MGVKWMFRWRSPQAGLGTATEKNLLVQMLIQLEFRLEKANFELKCHLIKQQSAPPIGTTPSQITTLKDLWMVSLPNAAERLYFVNRNDHQILDADSVMLPILEKNIGYKRRAFIHISGRRFCKGDFVAQLGAATHQVSGLQGSFVALGHILEVEYLPVEQPGQAQAMLEAFTELIRAQIPRRPDGTPMGTLDAVVPSFEHYAGLPAHFTNLHSAISLVDVCIALLRQHAQQKAG